MTVIVAGLKAIFISTLIPSFFYNDYQPMTKLHPILLSSKVLANTG